MSAARTVAMVGALLTASHAGAQQAAERAQLILRPMTCGDLARFDPPQLPARAVAAQSRLISVLVRWRPDPAEPVVNLSLLGRDASRFVVRGTVAQGERIDSALGVLRDRDVPHARLQVSLLTMPRDVASEAGHAHAVVTRLDEAKATALTRAAVRRDGKLLNLPERIVAPLTPFVVAPRAEPGGGEPRGVRLEMVPAAADTVLLGVHFGVGARAEPRALPAGQAADAPVVSLQAGQLVAIPSVDGAVANVLIVRCLDVTARALDPR
jgi:hypothetical protein